MTSEPPDSDPGLDEGDFYLDGPPVNESKKSFNEPVVSLNNDGDDEDEWEDDSRPVPPAVPKTSSGGQPAVSAPDADDQPIPLSSLQNAPSSGGFTCPRCLASVTKFTTGRDSVGGLTYHCPKCKDEVPLVFARDFGKHPCAQLSLAGLTGHGKTCFLQGLFHWFNGHKPDSWSEFSYEPLSDIDGQTLEAWLKVHQGGDLPEPSQKQVKTVGMRLYGIPGLGTLDLLLFDISGEAFTNMTLLQSKAFHVQRSDVVTLLVSLENVTSNFQLIRLLQDFQQGLGRMGMEVSEKSLLVVLTKGDTLLTDDTLPRIARQFLTTDVPLEPNDSATLDELSDALREWMKEHRANYSGFVNNAKRAFKEVRYTVISALGFAPTGVRQQFAMQPRNVVSPLVWLLHESLPEVVLKTEAGESRYFSLDAALEAADQVEDACPTIEIGPGRFRITDRILLERPLNLIGMGPDLTYIVGDAAEALLAVSAPVFRAAGISFIREGKTPGNVVVVAATLFDIHNCEFHGGVRDVKQNRLGHGLVIRSLAKGPRLSTVKRCKSSGNACGYHLLANSRVQLEKSHGDGNLFGLLVSGAADAEIISCTFNKNTSGVDVNGSGEVTLRLNKCEGNKHHGIHIRGSANLQVAENVCDDNQKDGIHVAGTARAAVTGNKASRNIMAGIRVVTTSATTVNDNRCDRNWECGIRIEVNAKPTVLGPNPGTNNGTNGKPPDRKKDIIDERKKWF